MTLLTSNDNQRTMITERDELDEKLSHLGESSTLHVDVDGEVSATTSTLIETIKTRKLL